MNGFELASFLPEGGIQVASFAHADVQQVGNGLLRLPSLSARTKS
jgi:hypothetical protein